MARATFVKAAAKDYPQHGIKKGESYYWWKFRHGSKQFSKTQPRRSQLTQSSFLSQLYDIQDEIGDLCADSSLPDAVEDIASRLRELGEECTSNRDNMPEALQDSDTGSMLQERADAMEAAADELESIDFNDAPEDDEPEAATEAREPDDTSEDEDDEKQDPSEYWQEKLDEVQAVSIDA